MEKQYNHQATESKIQQLWSQHRVYAVTESSRVRFTVDTPPPTVSGSLHIGHVFSYTHTDISARYKRMSGFSVIYPFGFDDNGLPTERYVEKKLGMRAESMKRSEFIRLCLQETEQAERQFEDLWRKLGFSANWDLHYSTISRATQKISQESFLRLLQKDYVYRKYEPAPYCPTCRTSVAQAELDDAQQETVFYDLIFKDQDGAKLTIATTRPEFLPACVAVLYHPDDERYAKLAGRTAKVPLFGFEVPFYAHEAVNPEKGTGLVMCCIFGDKQDVAWAKDLQIAYQEKQILGLDGKFNAKAQFLEGLTPHQARQKTVEMLRELNLIVQEKPISNVVNVHERCKKPIEYIALAQWFVKILPYKKELLAFAETITWHPEFMKPRFVNWVESLGWDWCISRQRFFGIPFPVWHCQKCQAMMTPSLNDLPVDPQETALFSLCTSCGSEALVPDSDVMDTWNTSSLTPQIIASLLGPDKSPFEQDVAKKIFPLSIRPQAHDIIRTWAFYTIVKAWMHYGDLLPWREVVISGHVLSDSKEKLSKSKENSKLAPENLLAQHSADAIRYWTASARLGHDVAFSENQLRIGAKLITKLWNAFRFIKEHALEVVFDKRPNSLGTANEWLLHNYAKTVESYRRHQDVYEISLALQDVEHFFWDAFCDNYVEIIKDQFFNPDRYTSQEIAATRWTLNCVGRGLLQLFAPYLPHVTEELYQEVYARDDFESIHVTSFFAPTEHFEVSAGRMAVALFIIKTIRRLKSEQQLSLKTPITRLFIFGQDQQLQDAQSLEPLIGGVVNAQQISYHTDEIPLKSQLYEEDNRWYAKFIFSELVR